MPAGNMLGLRLHSGVPIVDVLGSWDQPLTDALTDMVRALASAGHYDIVVNVQHAALEGISAVWSLTGAAEAVKSHCGHVDIVGTVDQIDRLVSERVQRLFRFAASEESAIGHIKRIPVLTAGVLCNTRPPLACHNQVKVGLAA